MSKNTKMNREPAYTEGNPHPIAINGILNMTWLKEQAKQMTPEKEKAIVARNEALRCVPHSKRKQWLEDHPLESFMEEETEIER